MRILGPALFSVLLLPLGSAADLQQTLAKMDAAAASFKGLTAGMKKVNHTFVIDVDDVEEGTLVVKRPKAKDLRALFAVTGTNPKMVAFSGRTVQMYFPAAPLVQIYDIDKKYGSQVNMYLLLGFGASSKELEASYAISLGGPETVAGQKTTRLELVPRKTDVGVGLDKAEIWISDDTGIALQQKFFLRGGDYQVVSYNNMKINPDIPDSAVTLNLPPNVKKEYPQR